MKLKINIRLGLVALVALALTTLGVTTVYYNLFQQQVRRDLRVTAEMLSASAVLRIPRPYPNCLLGTCGLPGSMGTAGSSMTTRRIPRAFPTMPTGRRSRWPSRKERGRRSANPTP